MRTAHNDVCVGLLEEAEGDRFNMVFFGTCNKTDAATFYAHEIVVDTTVSLRSTVSYFCLASFKDNYQNQFVITKSPDMLLQVNNTYLCWFIASNGRLVYWLPIGNCDASTELLIMKGKVTPLATLYFDACALNSPTYPLYFLLTAYWTMQHRLRPMV